MQFALPDKTKPVEGQTDLVLSAMCAWAEARGEGTAAMYGVLCVIRNRASHPTWWGNDARSVILKKWQFSSFSENDPNRAKMLDPLAHDSEQSWERASRAAGAVAAGQVDITDGATHYYDTSIAPPAWAKGLKPLCHIGRLVFHKVL